jgi:hypothetical protein
MGAKGGGARRYNAKTGRWDKLTYETKRTVSKASPATSTSARAQNAYSAAAVPLTTRQSNRSQLPTGSMTPLSYAKRIQGLRRSLQAAETRARITTGTAATRSKNKAEVERLKKEIATLSKKK